MPKQSQIKRNEKIGFEQWKHRIREKSFQKSSVLFQKGLLEWFKKNARDLPWRKTHDPYKILVSELMLQQTQVDRVIDFYHRFLSQFPDFQSIARASEDEVVKMWEGLGYYNRARNLRKCAIEIMEKYQGHFPQTKEEILALPGIGEYTAGAVMTFALNLRQPIVDTNVDRVLRRVFLFQEKGVSEHEISKILWLLAEALLPTDQYWEFNQGIMDFGAIQCTSDKPKCKFCPFRTICSYYQTNSLNRFMK